MSRKWISSCIKDRDMATNHDNHDPLRNPQVDYDRSDLSPSGILWFLIGLLVVGVFIELVIWGMFRFMAHSEVLFAPSQQSAMAAGQVPGPAGSRSPLQNTPGVNLDVFPEPRLQMHDAEDMSKYFTAEGDVLNVKQPFMDPSGAVHIPISMAMQMIAERGLPVRPNAPPPELNTQTGAGNPKILDEVPGPLPPGGAGEQAGKPAAQQK
jgi:hypothetical protein